MRIRTCPYNNGPVLWEQGNRYRCQKCGMVYHKDLLKDEKVWAAFAVVASDMVNEMRSDRDQTVGMIRQSLGVLFTQALREARRGDVKEPD